MSYIKMGKILIYNDRCTIYRLSSKRITILKKRYIMDDIKRILVVSRSTKNCRKAVHYGISLAKQNNSKLYVLHVIHDPFSVDGWNLPIPSLKQEYEKLVKKARAEVVISNCQSINKQLQI